MADEHVQRTDRWVVVAAAANVNEGKMHWSMIDRVDYAYCTKSSTQVFWE
jgi:hypothetical protein